MKPKTMILMGLAIACGLGASYMTSRLLAERSAPEEPEKVDILVAKNYISVHTTILKPEDMFDVKTVAKADEPAEAIKDFESLKGKKLKTSRNKGDTITPANLYDKNGAVEIPEGHQGIGIRVNLETAISGLATLPGSRVDLHLTVRSTTNLANDTKTIVLLENVLVLAADLDINPEGKIAAPAQVVLFALKKDDILVANAAMDMGTIRLIMRNKDDSGTATRRQIIGNEILFPKNKKDTDAVVVAKAEEPKPAPPPVVAETKPEPKPEPEPELPPAPRFTKHHFEIVNGAQAGKRSIEKVFYYRSVEDGRILSVEEFEAESGEPQPAAPRNAPLQPRKGSGQRGDL